MIMKANKQIGFIYKDNESIDKILEDGDVVFERGFLREKTSTTLPITFGGVGKDLKDYKVYGNTVQNGTPTPDTPIDMVSCGDRTKNLLKLTISNQTTNGLTLTVNEDKTITINGTASANTYFKLTDNYIFEPGEYTISGTPSGGASSKYFMFINGASVNDYGNGATNTFTQSTTSYVGIAIRNGQVYDNLIFKPQLELGSTATPYEPYGYKIPVNVRSDNLFDKDNYNSLNVFISNTGVLTANANNKSIYIPCKPNTTYTISRIKPASGNKEFGIAYTSEIPVAGVQLEDFVRNNTADSLTITTNNTAKFLIAWCYVSDYVSTLEETLSTIQIVEGSTVPSKYIPYYNETTNIYLDEPLRKIDEYSDYIDFVNSKVVRQLGEVVLDGDEDISSTSAVRDKYRFVVGIDNINMIAISGPREGNPILSDKYISKNRGQTYANETGIGYGNGTSTYKNLIIYDENLSSFTIEQFKTWLQSNNVIVDYVLETPTEEDIELPNIPTIEGNNTLNIETEVTPSQVYIKYKSNE